MPSSLRTKIFFCMIIFLLVSNSAFGSLLDKWNHLESEHFKISYKKKNKDIALMSLNIAEETANTIADYFGYDINEKKISMVVRDDNDYLNGSANRYNSLVVIECRKAEMFLRSENKWLRTIISHELSHIYSLRVMQSSALVAFSLINYSEPKGQNVMSIIEYQHNSLPIWFVEGIAQVGSYEFDADYRDPFREMLLRDSFHNKRLLTIDEMARFEGSSRESELAYNQGFDLLLFLINEYPQKSIKDLCHLIRKEKFKNAILSYYGKTIEELYEDWRESLKKRYPKKNQLIDGFPMFEPKKRIMNVEVRSVDDGKYTIANWRHDYNRYDLMIMDEDKKRVENVIRDVGTMIKVDQTTNSVWFNKRVNSRLASGLRYDIFRINEDGKTERMTFGKRCIAFDVLENQLMYASYKNGETAIILKDLNETSPAPTDETSAEINEALTISDKTADKIFDETPDSTSDDNSKILKKFDSGKGIYKISQITPSKAVLSIGTGERVKAGIIEGESFEILWEDLDTDVFDCIYAGSDRIIFVSTIDGTPQLYWCNLKNDQYTWFKITDVVGGARYPGIDYNDNNTVVTCSVYEDGHFTIYKLNNPFSKDHPLNISDKIKLTTVSLEDKRVFITNAEPKEIESNIVTMPQYFVGFNNITFRPFTDERVDTKNQLILGGSFFLDNAPGNFESRLNLKINRLFGYETVPETYPSASLWGSMKFWKLTLKQEVSYQSYYNEFADNSDVDYYMGTIYDTVEFKTSTQYNLFQDNILAAAYSYEWRTQEIIGTINDPDPRPVWTDTGTRTLTKDYGVIYKCNHWSMDWYHYRGRSKFDVGKLGQPSFRANAGVDLYINSYPGLESFEDSKFSYESCTVPKARFGLGKNTLLFDSKMSINLIADGFSYFTETDTGKADLFMYDILGHENMFSGYSYGSIYAKQLFRTAAEVRFNPLISIFNKTSWFERMNLGLKLEFGDLRHYDNTSDTLISAEGSISYSFYYWPSRLSNVYFKWATPLGEINGMDDYPKYSIYFGFTL